MANPPQDSGSLNSRYKKISDIIPEKEKNLIYRDLYMSESREGIRAAFNRKALAISGATRAVKFFLIYGGAALSACVAVFPNGFAWPPGELQILGLVGVALVALGGFFVTYTEDSAKVLNDAQQALLEADQAETDATEAALEAQQFAYQYEEATIRLRALYTVYTAARSLLETAASATTTYEETLLLRMMVATIKRDLRVAIGLKLEDTWTICVYKRIQTGPTKTAFLKCIAHDRTIDCDIEKARTWKEGVGVGGIALAKNSEVIAPDILDPAAISLFRLDDGNVDPEDCARYRSIISVPVHVGNDDAPWGVVVVTTDSENHFGYDHGGKGVPHEEGARALAGLVALAVAQKRQVDSMGASEKAKGEKKNG